MSTLSAATARSKIGARLVQSRPQPRTSSVDRWRAAVLDTRQARWIRLPRCGLRAWLGAWRVLQQIILAAGDHSTTNHPLLPPQKTSAWAPPTRAISKTSAPIDVRATLTPVRSSLRSLFSMRVLQMQSSGGTRREIVKACRRHSDVIMGANLSAVIASAAKQSISPPAEAWIASSLCSSQ